MTHPLCARCQKPLPLCVCEALEPRLENRVEVFVLQHPQEPDKTLGSAHILVEKLCKGGLRVGLSVPNLKALVGREVDPKRWGVLYLGSAVVQDLPLWAVNKEGLPLPDSPDVLKGLEGVVVLDGTWSQAKALWWRNPWLLKLRRLVVNPQHGRSLYGNLRKEPRRECLSTLESVALALSALECRPEWRGALEAPFRMLLEKHRKNPGVFVPVPGAGQKGAKKPAGKSPIKTIGRPTSD